MFEKEAEEYVMREDVITENDRVPFDNGYGFQTVSFEDEVKKGFQDGAEFGYNKAMNEIGNRMESAYREGVAFGKDKAKEKMQAQIEKMKCCGNCKKLRGRFDHNTHINILYCSDSDMKQIEVGFQMCCCKWKRK